MLNITFSNSLQYICYKHDIVVITTCERCLYCSWSHIIIFIKTTFQHRSIYVGTDTLTVERYTWGRVNMVQSSLFQPLLHALLSSHSLSPHLLHFSKIFSVFLYFLSNLFHWQYLLGSIFTCHTILVTFLLYDTVRFSVALHSSISSLSTCLIRQLLKMLIWELP